MHRFSVDYRHGEPERRAALVNKGFFLHGVPRPLLLCRMFGHKPVVAGTEGLGTMDPARWVCCDRCGERPDPQGHLDPNRWDIGQRYDGPYLDAAPAPLTRDEIQQMAREHIPFNAPPTPGPWPRRSTGDLGGQLIVGKSFPSWSAEVKVGNAGSEHTLAAHLRLHPFGALYLHTERFGTWLQRRLNPTGYQSRVIGVAIQFGGLDWKLWAKRDESSRDDPWWMHGTLKLDPRDRLFGRRHYDYTDVGEPVTATVRMPHGDDHEVKLQLQRCTFGRTKRRRFHSWTVEWECRAGIPTKPHGGEVMASGVDVSAHAVDSGGWPAAACAAIANHLAKDRARYGWQTPQAA